MMKTFILKSEPYAFGDRGWGNGYVVLPKGHPAHGLDYNDIHDKWDIDVNGGITFAQLIDEGIQSWIDWSKGFITNEDIGAWVVGFDTAHYMDDLASWPQEAVFEETQRLREQLEAIKTLPSEV